MLRDAQPISANVGQTCRLFGISRAQFYIWKKRFENNGPKGLVDHPAPNRIRFRIPLEVVALILRPRE